MLDNDTEISIPIPPKDIIKPTGPGARLRKIRETQHMTLDDMAKRIRLTHERLIQIENDDYSLMGAPAFAKGYLRAYANQLNVPKEDILDILSAFDVLNLGANIRHNKPELLNERMDQVGPKTTRWVSYLIFVGLLLGVLGYVWHNHAGGILNATAEKSPAESVETPLLPEALHIQPLATPAQSGKLDTSASGTQDVAPLPSAKTKSASTPQRVTSQLEE